MPVGVPCEFAGARLAGCLESRAMSKSQVVYAVVGIVVAASMVLGLLAPIFYR